MVVDNERLGRKEPNMSIMDIDYHPSDQYIAFADTETGECGERRLNHSGGEAEKFYRDLQQRGVSVRVGMEATGYSRWFERLLGELGSVASNNREQERGRMDCLTNPWTLASHEGIQGSQVSSDGEE
jgi:hypothetical protein